MSSNDTLIFMTSILLSDIPKKRKFKRKRNKVKLLNKYHIESLVFYDKLITRHGDASINIEYDYLENGTHYELKLSDEDNQENLKIDFSKLSWFFELLHSKNILLDNDFFDLSIGLNYECFVVTLKSKDYQVNPLVYFLNDVLHITYELIDLDTNEPLQKEDLIGNYRLYNMEPVTEYYYFSQQEKVTTNKTITNIILDDIMDFFSDLSRYQFGKTSSSWLNNIAVLSSEDMDVNHFFYNTLELKEQDIDFNDISTQNEYEYYLSEGLSININKNNNFISQTIRDYQILESLKSYVFIKTIFFNEIINEADKTVKEHLWLRYTMSSTNAPIATINVFNAIEQTEFFQRQEKSIELKLKLLDIQIEKDKNKNATILNILIYFLTVIAGIESAGFIENRFGIPLKFLLPVLIIVYGGFGIYLISSEINNKSG